MCKYNTSVFEITKEEMKAIKSLTRLAKKWPKTLWLFAGTGGGLTVFKTDKNGNPVHTDCGGVDQNYMITVIEIAADGGDY